MSNRLRELSWAIRFDRRPLDDAEIRRLYVIERRSSKEIAKRFGCEASTICRRLAAKGIGRRPAERAKAQLCACGKPVVKGGGAKCKFHRKLAVAKAARKHYRRKHKIPSYRWRVTHDNRKQKTRSDKGTGMTAEQLRVYGAEKMREYRRVASELQVAGGCVSARGSGGRKPVPCGSLAEIKVVAGRRKRA